MVTWRKKTSWAGSEWLWGTEAWNTLGHAALWCCSFDLGCIHRRTFDLDVTRGECVLELAGGCGGDWSFEVLMCGGPSPSSRWGGSSWWWRGRKSWLNFHKIYIWIAGGGGGLVQFFLSISFHARVMTRMSRSWCVMRCTELCPSICVLCLVLV